MNQVQTAKNFKVPYIGSLFGRVYAAVLGVLSHRSTTEKDMTSNK